MLDTLEKVQNFYKEERVKAFGGNSFTITFQVTGECNFRCSYCYEKKCPEKMSKESAKKLIDKLFPIEDNILWWNGYLRGASKKDDITLDFFGGECTLEIDTIEELCQYFIDKCNEDPEKYEERKKNFTIIIESNGSLLRTPKVEAFLRKWEPHIMLGVSLDGSKAFHDSCRVFKDGSPTWQIVKDNLAWAINEFPNLKKVKIKSTATSASLPYLYESYLLFKEIGLRNVDATNAVGCDWKDSDVEVAREQYQLILDDMLNDPHPIVFDAFAKGEELCVYEHASRGQLGTCGSAGDGIALSSDNKLYTCHQFSHITMYEEDSKDFSLGTVESGITDHGMEIANEILSSYNKNIFTKEECKACTMRSGCEFCPAFSYKKNKDVNLMEDDRCKIEKIKMMYGMRYKYEMEKRRWERKNSL